MGEGLLHRLAKNPIAFTLLRVNLHPMIRSFGDRETEKVFFQKRSRKLPTAIQERALAKLRLIHAATRIEDLRMPPNNHLHLLRGSLNGFHAIRINDQWRIVFRWEDGNAEEVKIADYH